MVINSLEVGQFTEKVLSLLGKYRLRKNSLAPHFEIQDTSYKRDGGGRPNCALFRDEYYTHRQKREDGLAFFFAVEGNIHRPFCAPPSLTLEEKIAYASLSFGLYKEDGRENNESSRIVVVEIGKEEKIKRVKVSRNLQKKNGFSLPEGAAYQPKLEYTIRFYATGRIDPLPE